MEFDFLIIGGGIAGASAGAALAGDGRVLLWEAESDFGYHASGRSAAMFEENYGALSVTALTRASREAHASQGWLSPRGLCLVGLAGQEADFDADCAALNLTPYDPEALRASVPVLSGAVTRVATNDAALDLDTNAMLQHGLRAVARAETRRRVTGVERVAGGWRVVAGDHAVTAHHVINAAGPWADDVAGLAGAAPLGLRPMRRSMARLRPPGGADVTGWPMLLGMGEAWYAKPDAGALIVSPGEEVEMAPMDAFADDMTLAEGLARYQEAVTEPVTRPLATWAGLRTFTPDRTLAIGPSEIDGIWWCAGQGGYGFQTAPAAARLLADRITGRAPELDAGTVAALDPGRLR